MNFTLSNHLQYSIGGRPFGHRQSPTEKYVVSVGDVDKDHYRKSSWREELRRTADSVLSDFGNEFIVFLSGGTDSEIVVRNFLEIGYKPRCVFIEFEDGYNAHDLAEAQMISRELDVKLQTVKFNVKDFFWSGKAAEFSQVIDCSQITYLMVYYHILQFDFPAVMGGELMLRKHITPQETFWYHCFRENEDASAMRFSQKYDLPVVNEWFSYTPEMMAYFVNDPQVRAMIDGRDQYRYKLTSVSSKNAILKRLYPDIFVRKKTHGFEKLMGFNTEAYAKLQYNMISRLEPSLDGTRLDKLFEVGNESY